MTASQSQCRLDLARVWSGVVRDQVHEAGGGASTGVKRWRPDDRKARKQKPRDYLTFWAPAGICGHSPRMPCGSS
jgi:hypothetical protein